MTIPEITTDGCECFNLAGTSSAHLLMPLGVPGYLVATKTGEYLGLVVACSIATCTHWIALRGSRPCCERNTYDSVGVAADHLLVHELHVQLVHGRG